VNRNHKLTGAVLAVLAAQAGAAYAQEAVNNSLAIDEIVVTAQRRSESIQDVPITIQALSGDTLKHLNVSTFNDLLKYTPNVTFSGNGPGTGNIFMRGLSAGGSGNQSQSTTAPMPNVALYLDDQSMQFPARNVDVYMVDMERVEVLEGPQGTLFGGGAQAGVLRYITNKPKLDVTEGTVNAGYGITAGGDPNANVNATLNLPLIDGKLAVRGVFFQDHRGGYISNVPGTIQTHSTVDGTLSPVASNNGSVGSNLNTVDYNGFRLSALYQINDDWNFLVQQNYQNFKADGYFASESIGPNGQVLGQNQTMSFTPNFDKDKYESTAWTLNGKFGDWKGVYTGSYMTRHIEQQADYSNYMTSAHGSYYACTGTGAGYAYFINNAADPTKPSRPTKCYAPVGSWLDTVSNTHQSHEIRFSSPESARIRGTFGAFWEDFQINDIMNFNYMPIPQCTNAYNIAQSQLATGGTDCVQAVGPIPGYFANDPNGRVNTNTAFGEDVQRGYRQLAEFASIDLDLIRKVLTVTAGTRHFKYDEYEKGSEYYSATTGVLNTPGVCTTCGFGMNLKKSESGFRSRGNITWHVTPDVMAYYTYSQGFRPGGFNRTSSAVDGTGIGLKAVAPYSSAIKNSDQYLKPLGYNSDNLINNEVGVKTEFLDHRIQVNASAYQMKWESVQLPLFDPSHLGNTTFDVNGPSYKVKGFELQLVARVTEGLTIQGSGSWNSSDQTDAPCLSSSGTDATVFGGKPNKHIANNPTPAGQCITQINGQPYSNPYGVLGTSPAYSPAAQFNIRARYDWTIDTYKAFATFGANHIGSMRNEPASFPDGTLPSSQGGCLVNGVPNTTLCKYTMPGYSTYDASLGVSKNQWTAQVTGNNLSNSNASQNTNSGQFIQNSVVLRPRVLTLGVSYKF